MFEVGKFYKRPSFGDTFEVLCVGQRKAMVRFIDGREDTFLLGQAEDMKEYTPPKVYTSELCVNLSRTNKELYTTHRKYEDVDEVGRIRITFTEGQGLAVEVLS